MSETPDQAATRRRWISLAEILAVSGVMIAALTLWMNWSDKRQTARERAIAAEKASAIEARFALTVEASEDGREVRLSDPAHELLETNVTFPASLGIEQRSPAKPRVEREWFASRLLETMDGGADEREGRLPVLITAKYRVGDQTRTGKAIVDIVWRTKGRLIGGRSLTIEAAQVREMSGDPKRIETIWSAELKRQRARA